MATRGMMEEPELLDNPLRSCGDMETPNTNHSQLRFSRHARVRQKQRNITDNSAETVIQQGEQLDSKDAAIYTDQDIKLVLGKDSNTVITVNHNTRNTRFKLSERTQDREKTLLYEVKKHNNSHAMCELAELYLNGHLGDKDPRKAFNLFERAAKLGNSHAMCRVSHMYETNDLGAPNPELANMWLKRAAQRNNVFANSVIGQKLLTEYKKKYAVESKVYRPRVQKERMQEEILFYLNRGADKGHSRAIWQLGNLCETGLFGEKDLSKAIDFYVKAAKTGSPASLDSLHDMTLDGRFSVKELEEILDHLFYMSNTSISMAVQLGEAQLLGNLGNNKVRGLKMIEQVALKHKEYDEAILKLAECYRDGTACEANLTVAQFWFNKLRELYEESAAAGNLSSLRKLAGLYLDGSAGNIDPGKAESCFRESVEKSSNIDWTFDLGMLYLNGILGDKPIEIGIKLIAEAIKMWLLQASSTSSSVCHKLGHAYLLINNHKKAVHWLSKTSSEKFIARSELASSYLFTSNASSDLTVAQANLAKIYLDNRSPEKNVSLGVKILETIILEHNLSPSTAFSLVNFQINDQTLPWLLDMAGDLTKPVPEKGSNQYNFQEFVITTIAGVYEKGESGIIDYSLASKYYHQLFVNFKSLLAQVKLVWLYSNQYLPTEYHNTLREIPAFLKELIESDETDFYDFSVCILSLLKIYKTGDESLRNLHQMEKWLYLALYRSGIDTADEAKQIDSDLAILPPIDSTQRAKVLTELAEITKSKKSTSSLYYKVLSRILGDIFYDGKIADQNIDEAIYWYTESAKFNNKKAAFALGNLYENDKKDIKMAIEWYKLSAQLGHEGAFDRLREMAAKQEDDNISSFLNGYEHQSLVEESELVNIKPLNNLKVYPQTTEEIFELGKSCLNSGSKQDLLNAEHWFNEAMREGSIEAAMELHLMYKSGLLGNNLVPRAENLYLTILKICHVELNIAKRTVLCDPDIPEKVSLLNNLLLVLRVSDMTAAAALIKKTETLINETHNINFDNLAALVSGLETIILELHSQNKISNAVDACLLAERVSDQLNLEV